MNTYDNLNCVVKCDYRETALQDLKGLCQVRSVIQTFKLFVFNL
jgi:hypothetical protein